MVLGRAAPSDVAINDVNLSRQHARFTLFEGGQVMVLMAMAVAAAEVALGLSIVIALFRHVRSVDVDAPRATLLRN